ncbi:MAG: hypothetical protein H6747_06780 [Deltaproteobacteria bacterium]|nr:hypothetical protein [Deltaproteobacteria bacterium]
MSTPSKCDHLAGRVRADATLLRLLPLPLLLAGLLSAAAAAAATPGITPDHERPTLDAAAEAAWLQALVAASPHRIALEQANAAAAQDVDILGGSAGAPTWPIPAISAATTGKAWPKKAGRRFYGYLPYWTSKGITLHWQTLTQLAWFSAELAADGTIGNTHGWGSAEAKALIAEAHAHGVQVTLCITLFSTSGIGAVIETAAKRQALVEKLVALVLSGGGDGINIDFEGLAKADKQKMVDFITALSDAMHKALPGSDVTLATPAVDWSGAWDYDALAEASDGLFIMAYGLHWSGGPPGPNLPMKSDAPWKHKTLVWVLDDYFQWGKAANKHKFIVGLPFYGHVWASSSDQPGATALGKGKSVTYENAVKTAPSKGGWKWDAASQSSWYLYKEGGDWMQAWIDDQPALQLRVDEVDDRDVMLGCWALGYADTDAGVWQMLESWRVPSGGGAGADAGGGDADAVDAGAVDAGSGDAGSADAGPVDVGSGDAGSADAGSADAGSADVGSADAGSGDAGSADAGSADAGSADAGSADAGSADAGSADAGSADAGSADAGSLVGRDQGDCGSDCDVLAPVGEVVGDAGSDWTGPTTSLAAPANPSGCSADRNPRSGTGTALLLLLAGAALAVLRRRFAA